MDRSAVEMHGDVLDPPRPCPYMASSPAPLSRSLRQSDNDLNRAMVDNDLNATMAPFRRVAFEHMPPVGRQFVAPTVVDPEEWKIPKETFSKEVQADVPAKQKAASHIFTVPSAVEKPTHTVFNINANVVHVYKVAPCTPSSERPSCPTCNHEQPEKAESASNANNKPSIHQAAAWGAWNAAADYEDTVNQKVSMFPVSPRVYPVTLPHGTTVQVPNLEDMPVSATAPPEFLDDEHIQALRRSDHQHYSSSDSGEYDHPDGVSKALSEGGSHSLDDEVLLDPQSEVCPEGKEACFCKLQSIELFKKAAAYLYKHSRNLNKDFFDAHVHVGERILHLQQLTASSGGPSLPSSVYAFLQTETSQLLQEWAIAEARCGQYMCDCILADVNGLDASEPSEGNAKSIPPDFFNPDSNEVVDNGTANVVREEEPEPGSSATARLRNQSLDRFAELKGDLLALRERSERLKLQWANLLDLCNKLEEVARIGKEDGFALEGPPELA